MRAWLTFYTDRFIPEKFGGMCVAILIFIRPKYRDDIGLLRHEETHRRQWLLTIGLYTVLYPLCRRFRQWAEVEAYREQLKHYPDDRSWRLAEFLATKYDLALTQAEAHRLLTESTS